MATQHSIERPIDPIPREDEYSFTSGSTDGLWQATFFAFNTVVSLQAFAERDAAEEVFDAARAMCRRYERLFSRTLPNSDMTRIHQGHGDRVEVDEETFRLLSAALAYCEENRGLFDITVGTLVKLWAAAEDHVPDRTMLSEAASHVDWRKLLLTCEDDQCFAQLLDMEASVDVGGIAKGYIADAITDLFLVRGVESFVINLGGNVVVHGEKPDGTPWTVGIRDPHDKTQVLEALAVRDASLVTSGIFERGYELDGVWYHHILNPSTGFPIETDVASASVIAAHSIDAEGYSTTLVALGLERGLAFAREHPRILAAAFVDMNNQVHWT